jgi:hypothetical protein
MLQLYLKGKNVKKPTGETVTGKPVTNPVVVALDTSIIVAYIRHTADSLLLNRLSICRMCLFLVLILLA